MHLFNTWKNHNTIFRNSCLRCSTHERIAAILLYENIRTLRQEQSIRVFSIAKKDSRKDKTKKKN